MLHTPLKDRKLTAYTPKEELFNAISHGIGVPLALIALVLCIKKALESGSSWNLASAIIYGTSMLLLYSMSACYHGSKDFMAKRVFQVLDHCAIFLLIAGTYTPLTLSVLRPRSPVIAWIILAVVWISALVGIILNAIDLKHFSKFSMICYIAMGWCIIFAFRPLQQAMPSQGIWLLLFGGIAYTVGAVLYGIGKRRYTFMHGVFHVFVIIGSVFHFFFIFLYGLPN